MVRFKRSRIAKCMGPTWGPPGSCRPQMGPMLVPWTLLSGDLSDIETGLQCGDRNNPEKVGQTGDALAAPNCSNHNCDCPDNKVHGANVGPTWGWQDLGGFHIGYRNLASWVSTIKVSLSRTRKNCNYLCHRSAENLQGMQVFVCLFVLFHIYN